MSHAAARHSVAAPAEPMPVPPYRIRSGTVITVVGPQTVSALRSKLHNTSCGTTRRTHPPILIVPWALCPLSIFPRSPRRSKGTTGTCRSVSQFKRRQVRDFGLDRGVQKRVFRVGVAAFQYVGTRVPTPLPLAAHSPPFDQDIVRAGRNAFARQTGDEFEGAVLFLRCPSIIWSFIAAPPGAGR